MHLEIGYIKIYGFLSFAKNMGTHATKVVKNVSNKYSQKLFDSVKKLATDIIKTASKRVIQKTPEAAGDLIGNKITDKKQVFRNLQKNCIQMNYIYKQIRMK